MERFVEDRMAADAQGNAAAALQAGLRRQDTVDWRDTNMALFGSDVESKIKENAAASEMAWRGAGTVKGLLIWRIEKFKVGLAAVSAIGFMQLSLLTCPLTFYQIYKVRVPALARYRLPS